MESRSLCRSYAVNQRRNFMSKWRPSHNSSSTATSELNSYRTSIIADNKEDFYAVEDIGAEEEIDTEEDIDAEEEPDYFKAEEDFDNSSIINHDVREPSEGTNFHDCLEEQSYFLETLRCNAEYNSSWKRNHDLDSVVSKFIDRAEKKVQERSTDQQTNEDNTIFERNGTSTATLREFSNEFVEWAIHHRITEAAMIHILNVLHRNTSNLNLPIKVIVNRRKRFTEKVEDIGTNDFEQNKELNVEERITADDTVQAIKKDWDKHIFTDDSLLEIDVCINGCEAFCGRQEKNIFCSVCKEKRFSNCCPYSSCRNKPYSFCNPFEGKFCETSKMLKPPHKLIYRTPQRRIFYRSIIQNLAKLHLGNRKNNNVNGISSNLSSDYLMTRRFPNDGEMEDVVDSPAWKNINSAMRTYFHLIAKPKLEKTLAAHQMNDYKIVPFLM